MIVALTRLCTLQRKRFHKHVAYIDLYFDARSLRAIVGDLGGAIPGAPTARRTGDQS
jgi:hypothetical protein